MVIITTIIDLLVLISMLTLVLELLYLTQKLEVLVMMMVVVAVVMIDKDNMIRNIILNTIFKILCWSCKYIVL